MIRPGVCSFAVMIAASPIGPAPTIATVSPGLDAAVEDADLVGRRQDVGEEQHLLVGQRRPGPCRREVSANGTRAYSAWRPSIRWPKIQPPPPVQRP